MKHPLFTDVEKLNTYIKLPALPEVMPSNSIHSGKAFITGATGFIGGFLLKELLQQNTFESYICLVRGNTPEKGLQRLKANLLAKGASEELINSDKLSVVMGDILAPHYGLDTETYEELCSTSDHFFHFAASMNWVLPFNRDTEVNIEAIKTAIQFCATKRLKKLHYASSMGMWAMLHNERTSIFESSIHNQGDELPGGYFQSKWINEKILHLSTERGIPVNIYRIGDVKGDSASGMGDPHNFGNLFMQYLLQRGLAIDSSVPQLNFLPVDFLAKAIAHISIKETGKTFQFSNSELISIKDIAQSALSLGHQVEFVSYNTWLTHLKSDKSQLGTTLKPIFRSFTPYSSQPPTSFYAIGMELFRKRHDTSNTDKALQHTEIKCPPIKTGGVLSKYLIHLVETVAL